MIRRCAMFLLGFFLLGKMAQGYAVGPPLGLDKLSAQADLIFKGTAISTTPGNGRGFAPLPGFGDQETEFKIISILKGDGANGSLKFRHYDPVSGQPGMMYEPQYYHFEIGRTYLVFAKKNPGEPGFQQLWMSHKGKMDQGVVRCADDKAVTGKMIKEEIWSELTGLLSSHDSKDVRYAIDELDTMSGGGGWDKWGTVSDFDRPTVLAAVHELMASQDADIAQAALAVIGSHNPYMAEERAEYWLATVGSAKIEGLQSMDRQMKNAGGELYTNELIAVADGKSAEATRALAITALGLVRQPALEKALERWLADPSPAVRGSAIILLADYPSLATHERLSAFSTETVPSIRVAVAHSIGFGQHADSADILAKLLNDPDSHVRKAAAMSLLSFSPQDESIATIFKANLNNPEFSPLFLNELARANPAPYLEPLAQAVEHQANPHNWWGGQIPAFATWEILFKYLQGLPVGQITSGKMDRYLDALEKVGDYGSSEPRDIYAFYIQRGMTGRARNYRVRADKAATYDLDQYFKQVDSDPAAYKRE